MKGLNELKFSWNTFAETDAMGAVLTGKEWDESSFYDSGQAEVDSLMEEISHVYPELRKEGALDFGCGLGRLSFALRPHFSRVTGVDISSKMIAQAAAKSRCSKGVEFLLNESESLEKIPSESFDFLLSLIVLQHIPKKFIKDYLREFLRVTRPGGLIVFQIPTRKIGPVKKEVYLGGTAAQLGFPLNRKTLLPCSDSILPLDPSENSRDCSQERVATSRAVFLETLGWRAADANEYDEKGVVGKVSNPKRWRHPMLETGPCCRRDD